MTESEDVERVRDGVEQRMRESYEAGSTLAHQCDSWTSRDPNWHQRVVAGAVVVLVLMAIFERCIA